MNFSKLRAIALVSAALAMPAAGHAQDAKPGEFKIPGTNTTLKLNGFVELDATYDFSGADEDIRGDDWASFLEFQPLDRGERDKDRLYVTARTSRVGLTTTTPTDHGNLVVRVEGDFNSPSAFNYSTEATTNGTNFRIRHAYGEYAGFLVGQTWANFMDLGSLPDTVDFNPHGAFALTRSPGVRYTANFGGPTLAVALENPQSLVLNTEKAPGTLTVGREFDRYPDVSANLTVPFSLGHLNLRAVTFEYQGRTAAGVHDSRWAWGAGVSGSVKLGKLDSVVWSVQGGDGIGRYMFTTLFQGAAFVGNDIEMWSAVAYHVGLTHNWSPTFRSNLIWTQTFFDKDDALAAELGDPLSNKRIDAGYVNSFYSPVKNVELGLEYAYGRRTVFAAALADPSNDVGTQHRVNALARYTFF
ncbi:MULTISPECIES: DcaP family trimeric outer membrane transporter [Anaeromyxobacter]|uniref:DcaP family trimeric outer membrane transporter n=1 Tax=Anaeromyxobacter TaxID=161492 RepID=UPI001F574A89|nr:MULTISPECIES: DcaP family trimeric outer membrane transporter [unclassified Anaeromyxobacter]